MARLDNAKAKAVNEMLKDARDVEIYSIPPFANVSDISQCLNNLKNILIKNKGKDVKLVVSVR